MKTGSLVLIALTLLGCGDDDTSTEAPASPTLRLLGARGPHSTKKPVLSGCVEVGQDPDRTAFVVLDVDDYDLKPPGACRGQNACGAVLIAFLDGKRVSAELTGVLSHAPVKFSQLPLGEYEIAVNLMNDSGQDAGASACSQGPCRSGLIRFAESCSDKSPLDGGQVSDGAAPFPDSGLDSGVFDAGRSTPDAAAVPDASASDGGAALDASTLMDASTVLDAASGTDLDASTSDASE